MNINVTKSGNRNSSSTNSYIFYVKDKWQFTCLEIIVLNREYFRRFVSWTDRNEDILFHLQTKAYSSTHKITLKREKKIGNVFGI